jgi:hypothetical protein
LLSVHTDDDLKMLVQRLERRLTTRRMLNPYAAEWTVKTWAQVLRLWSVSRASQPIAGPLERQSLESVQRSSAKLGPTANHGSLEETLAATRAAAQVPIPTRPVQAERMRSVAPRMALNRWIGAAGAIAAIVIVVVAIRFEATRPASPLPTTAEPAAATPPVAPEGVASSPMIPPSSTSRSAVEIADVSSDEPLVGDGRQRELFVSLRTKRDDVESVESRFVDGDAALWSQPVIVDVSSKSIRDARVPAGMIGVRTTKPVKATFEYIVTMTDGKRSVPFKKELSVAPVAATPPSIIDIAAPTAVVAGKPFSLSIVYRKGDGNVASIERKIINEKGEASQVATTSVTTLKPSKNGSLDLQVKAPKTVTPTAVELTLVDDSGQRSAPKRVAFDVATPPARSSTAGVAGASCTRGTCGTIVSVRELDSTGAKLAARVANALHLSSSKSRDRAQHSYEVIVRTDDRAVHTIRQRSPAKSGARVRIVGGKLLAQIAPSTKRAPHRHGQLVPESEPIVNQ